MIIQIDEDNRIVSDDLCWTIQERSVAKTGKNAGQELWQNVAYYTTIGSALKSLGERLIRKSEASNITDAVKHIYAVSDKIQKAFTINEGAK